MILKLEKATLILTNLLRTQECRGYVPLDNTYRDGSVDTKKKLVEIFRFKHFVKHFVFSENDDKFKNKTLKRYVMVSVVVDMECGDTRKCF